MNLEHRHELDSLLPGKKVKIVLILPEHVDENLKEEISERMDQFCKEIEELIDERGDGKSIGG